MSDTIIGIIQEIVYMFLEMSPYIILGLIFVALLNIFVSKAMIIRHVGSNNFLSVLKASLFGIPLPLCSCGVVPTAVYLSKNGASKGATISFLISTPQTGVDSIIATYGMLGPLFAFFRPFAALIMGIVGGLSVKLSSKKDLQTKQKPKFISINQFVEVNKRSELKPKRLNQRIKETLNYSFVEFLDDISVQFILGVILAGLISYFIPNDYFVDTGFNSGIWGMLLMIAIGVPMYVCATASIPIAMALMMKGFSPGVAFVFLATGPATNAASIAIISKSLGKQVTLIYLSSIAVLSIVMGYMLDFVYSIAGEGSIIHNHSLHEHSDMFLSDDMKLLIGVIFFGMILMSFYRKYFAKYFTSNEKVAVESGTRKVMIDGMTCNHCVATVTNTAQSIKGVENIEVRLNENAAYIKGKFDMDLLKKEIGDVGYKVTEVKS